MTLLKLKQDLQALANPRKATILSRFFKTGKGEYGEGDIFLGITVPQQREVAKQYADLPLSDLQQLLKSKIHEHRLTTLLILVEKFKLAAAIGEKEIVDFYLRNNAHVNNWDLVDLSADKILGSYIAGKDKSILYKLAKSDNLWQRRIAIIATFAFIRRNEFNDALRISQLLLNDDHDLIQKAVGWMLREIGKRNQAVEEAFLQRHCKTMPRTTLRYAIERFTDDKKRFYLVT